MIIPTRLCSQFTFFYGSPDQKNGRTPQLQNEVLHERKFPKRHGLGRPLALRTGGLPPSSTYIPQTSLASGVLTCFL